jgi:hypothetical protein
MFETTFVKRICSNNCYIYDIRFNNDKNYYFVSRQKTGPAFTDSGPVECGAPPSYQTEKMEYYKY